LQVSKDRDDLKVSEVYSSYLYRKDMCIVLYIYSGINSSTLPHSDPFVIVRLFIPHESFFNKRWWSREFELVQSTKQPKDYETVRVRFADFGNLPSTLTSGYML
jgi:hypothetical protein